VRSELQRAGYDALVVPSSDPRLSEYPPARWRGLEWLTGFTGSAGTLAMTTAGAALFVDGRYGAQADVELAANAIETVRVSSSAGLPYCDWLVEVLPRGATVAIDGDVVALVTTNALRDRLARADIALVSHLDVLGVTWCDRPTLPSTPIRAHTPPHATRTRTENLGYVRSSMAERAAPHHLISTLDDVAWLLNLRGADVDHTPVFVAHLLLSERVNESPDFIVMMSHEHADDGTEG
jgi:Xaa-Pro aminopeptidase